METLRSKLDKKLRRRTLIAAIAFAFFVILLSAFLVPVRQSGALSDFAIQGIVLAGLIAGLYAIKKFIPMPLEKTKCPQCQTPLSKTMKNLREFLSSTSLTPSCVACGTDLSEFLDRES